MTETQTPKCADCGDTGYIPPFMDRCPCGALYVLLDIEDESPLPDPLGLQVGDFRHTPEGGVEVWMGSIWAPVPTETMSVDEYYEKYPEKLADLPEVELADTLVEDEAEKAALHAGFLAAEDGFATIAEIVTGTDDAMTEFEAALDATTDAAVYGAWDVGAAPATPPADPTVHAGRPASDAQIELVKRLIAERDTTITVVAAAIKSIDSPVRISSKHASRLIDALTPIPATHKAPRPNKYAGFCTKCRGSVAGGAGRIEQIDGKWKTFHLDGMCLTAAATAILDAERVTEPGLYWHTEGAVKVIYRARFGRSSKRLYAEKVIVYPPDEDGHRHVEFAYNANAMTFLRAADKMTWKEARDFGALYGNCVACGRNLHDPRSVVQNYGATCAAHFGWPTVTLKQAEGIIAGAVTWEEVTGLAL